jgi:acyl-CoA thioesterase II
MNGSRPLKTLPPSSMDDGMNDGPSSSHPTPAQLVKGLVDLLTVEPVSEDTYVGKRSGTGVGRLFGGEVIAQALMAANATVDPDRFAHSLHAYFLRGGNEDHNSDCRVERDFDGGSFSNRRVIVTQQGRPILNLATSFHKREESVEHQDMMPSVPPPEDLPTEAEQRRLAADQIPERMRPMMLRPRAIEMRGVEPRHWMNSEPRDPITHSWFKAVAPLPDDPLIHRAILAYTSDMTLLGTCALPHGLSWMTGELQSASLDHAIWFHDENFRCDDWLLYVTDSPWAAHARGFNRGRIFTRAGRLVASVAQEGLIRKTRPKG